MGGDRPGGRPGIARLGPYALSVIRTQLEDLFAGTERKKTALTDQTVMAGVGNAYSDEIMHTARLSPYATAGKLSAEALDALHEALTGVLSDAVTRSSARGGDTEG